MRNVDMLPIGIPLFFISMIVVIILEISKNFFSFMNYTMYKFLQDNSCSNHLFENNFKITNSNYTYLQQIETLHDKFKGGVTFGKLSS